MKSRLMNLIIAVFLAGAVAACDDDGPRTRSTGVVYVAGTHDPFWYWFDHHYTYYWHPKRHVVYWDHAYDDYWYSLDKRRRHLQRQRYRRWLHRTRHDLRPRLADDAFVERHMRRHLLERAQSTWQGRSLKQKQTHRRRLDRARLDDRLPGRVGPLRPARKRPLKPAAKRLDRQEQARPPKQQRVRPKDRIAEQRQRVRRKDRSAEQGQRVRPKDRNAEQRQRVRPKDRAADKRRRQKERQARRKAELLIPTPQAQRKIRRIDPPVQPKKRRPYSAPSDEKRRKKNVRPGSR